MQATLDRALLAESNKQWLESLALCRSAQAISSDHPDVLNLLGRLVGLGGDAARAIALQRVVLRQRPDHLRAAEDLRIALVAVRSPEEAHKAYRGAIELEPDIQCHHRHPGSLEPFAGIDQVEAALLGASAWDPSHALAQAALGNVHARRGRYASALDAYSLAVMLDPNLRAVHLALAELLELLHEPSAARHRETALAAQRMYLADEVSEKAVQSVLVLMAPGDFSNMNAPLDFLVNHNRIALHRCYLLPGGPFDSAKLPDYDSIFNAIDENEASQATIEMAVQIIASQSKPALNRPQHLGKTARSALRETLSEVRACVVPVTKRLAQDALKSIPAGAMSIEGIAFPLLIRPVNTHGGRGLERLAAAHEIPSYLERLHAGYFNVAEFVDNRNADGYYRKYRVVVVDGKPLPYHLAISPDWMVHYISSPMEEHAWMREEEERFLADPRCIFPDWDRIFGEMAAAIGLDYFGVDCTLLPDGRIFVFEAGPAMLVHCRESLEMFAYKYRYVPRIFDVFEEMLAKRKLN
ncbi:MAG: tetratricopeptide repeat protein [Candidatus Baltobacteraceae bacterium]